MEGQCVVVFACYFWLRLASDDIRKSWPFSWPATFRKKCWPVCLHVSNLVSPGMGGLVVG